MRTPEEAAADDAMYRIWKEWLQFYEGHFRKDGIAISAADQAAFYEIAQPLLRQLTVAPLPPSRAWGGQAMIDVLKEAERQIVDLHDRFGETGSGNATLARIRTALIFAVEGIDTSDTPEATEEFFRKARLIEPLPIWPLP